MIQINYLNKKSEIHMDDISDFECQNSKRFNTLHCITYYFKLI